MARRTESQMVMRGHEWVDIGQIQANQEAALVLNYDWELSLMGPVVHIGKSQAVAQAAMAKIPALSY